MRPKRILLYYPPNTRSIAMETICKTVVEAGHTLFVVTLTEKGVFHEILEEMGIRTYSHVIARKPSLAFFHKQARLLIKFCRRHKIDIVWSHLQEANLIAVSVQGLIRARLYVFRHHDESSFYAAYGKKFGMVRNRKEILVDRFINRFAKKIVVLSNHVKQVMIELENCRENKIIVCPLMYDFSRYPLPDQMIVEQIKDSLPCSLRIIMVSRLIESKQHLPVFQVIKKLVAEGLSIKMIVMDDGPLRPLLEKFIKENELAGHIIMPGYSTDLINYMDASDLLMHPSLTEASSNVVKEMGLLQKAVAVCEGVGDFDDYIKEGEQGFKLDRSDLATTIEKCIRKIYQRPELADLFGRNLHQKVLERFSNTKENKQRYMEMLS